VISNSGHFLAVFAVLAGAWQCKGADDKAGSQGIEMERFSATFSGGLIVSKEKKDFSKTDPYLAIDTESYFHSTPKHVLAGLVNIRLTSIPVSDSAASPVEDLPGFIATQKAAVFQAGLFYGYSPAKFKWKENGTKESKEYEFFIGPIAKFGFQSVADAQKLQRAWNPDDDLYDFGFGGARVALMEKSGQRRDYIAYLDVAVGKFQNFERAVPISQAAKAYVASPSDLTKKGLTKSDFDVSKPNRLFIEGRLRFPPLKALYVGVDINNGSGRDDMRFLAGVTFDLFGTLKKVMTPAEKAQSQPAASAKP
jgi:hypothetical protein